MPIKNRFILLYILAALLTNSASNAQEKGQSQFNLGYGLVSPEQLYVCTHSAYASTPYAFTGAIFLSYRYFLSNHIGIGFSVGIDNVKGDLTYGNPEHNGTYMEGTIGTYIDNTFTIAAPELYIKYGEGKYSTYYGSAGIGYTFSKMEKAYNPAVFSRYYSNGKGPGTTSYDPYDLPSVNPYYPNIDRFTYQITVFGVRSADKKTALFFELGYGYKGLFHGGFSLNL